MGELIRSPHLPLTALSVDLGTHSHQGVDLQQHVEVWVVDHLVSLVPCSTSSCILSRFHLVSIFPTRLVQVTHTFKNLFMTVNVQTLQEVLTRPSLEPEC